MQQNSKAPFKSAQAARFITKPLPSIATPQARALGTRPSVNTPGASYRGIAENTESLYAGDTRLRLPPESFEVKEIKQSVPAPWIPE